MAFGRKIIQSMALIAAVLSTVSAAGEAEDIVNRLRETLSYENVTVQFKKDCLTNADSAAFDRLKVAHVTLNECTSPLLNVEELQQELETYIVTKNATIIVKNYCRVSTRLQRCIVTFMDSFAPCLDEYERQIQRLTLNVVDALDEFVCFDDGERFLRFLSADGVQCAMQRWPRVKNCTTEMFSNGTAQESSDGNTELSVHEKRKCLYLKSLKHCFVAQQKSCLTGQESNGTDVDSVLNTVYEATPCGANVNATEAGSTNSVDSLIGLVQLASLAFA